MLMLLVCSAVLADSLPKDSMMDLAITNARLVDGNGQVRSGAGILVKDGKIAAILTSGKTPLARRVIDAGGATVMPGLIDTHVHLCVSDTITDDVSLNRYMREVVTGKLSQFLDHGVTTIRSMGDPEDAILDLRIRIANGEIPGPRLQVVGPGITVVNGHPAVTVYGTQPFLRERSAEEIDSPESAARIVNRLADKGVDAIKILYEGSDDPGNAPPNLMYQNVWGIDNVPRFSIETLQALINVSHERGLRIVVHAVDEESTATAVALGADELAHGLADEPVPVSEELTQKMRDHGIYYSATLQVYAAIAPAKLDNASPQLKRVADAGVNVTVGSDTFGRLLPGHSTLREIELMVEAGLTPALAIQAATGNAAASLGLDDTLGSLTLGKRADILVVDGDPLTNISALRNLSAVIQNGQIIRVDRALTN
jgi:imidazolonepropionase-like amidohydrolase